MKFEDLSPAEREEMKETFAMWRKPPEYFDKIVNSGMCNSIINGYILLAFDVAGVKPQKGISHLLDEYSADEARKRYQR